MCFYSSTRKPHGRWPWIAPWIVIVAAVPALSACSAATHPGWHHELPPPAEEEGPPGEVDFSAACDDRRWIGTLEAGPGLGSEDDMTKRPERRTRTCPEGWQQLFAAAGDPPPGLQRFCYYEGGDPRDEYRVIEDGHMGYGPFASIHRDCRVVGPAAESVFSRYFWPLRNRFVREAGRAEAPVAAHRVRLAIVDSVRDDAERPERDECMPRARGDRECSPHGWALVNLAKDLLCDPGRASCAADVGVRRVLRWTYEIRRQDEPPKEIEMGIGEPGGGLYGSRRDLALAIRREVADWWATPDRPHLILNLSVGWEGIYGEEAPEVRGAIEDAVCRGALVVAAAGNRRAGPRSLDKPLLPAAWERDPAPTFARCRALIGEPPPPSLLAPVSYRPLLYAVGGVRQGGRVLANGRPNATPRLVAFGDHAPVLYPSSPPWPKTPVESSPARTLTGTSISTLVVAAAAAARWNEDLDLSPYAVMDRLWQASAPYAVDLAVDFCLDPEKNCPPGQQARRVFVHPGAAAAAASPEQDRPTIDSYKQEFADATRPADFFQLTRVADCDPDVLAYGGELPADANLCPQRWSFDVAAQPWLGPQPESDHNPDCTYTQGSPGMLVLEFDPCFRIEGAPARLDDLTLVVDDKAFRLPMEAFTLGDPARECPGRPGDDPRRVQLVLTDFSLGDPDAIYLAATVNGKHAAITPILHLRYQDE